MTRVILEHADGRRVAAEDTDLDDPSRNPFNHGGNVVSVDVDTGASSTSSRAGRPSGDHKSLRDEGFEVVGEIDPETGNERAVSGT